LQQDKAEENEEELALREKKENELKRKKE